MSTKLPRGVLAVKGANKPGGRTVWVYAVWFKREVAEFYISIKHLCGEAAGKLLSEKYPEYPTFLQSVNPPMYHPYKRPSSVVTEWARQYAAGLLEDDNTIAVCRRPTQQHKAATGEGWTYRVGDSHYATEEDAMRRATELVLAGNTKVVIHRLEEVVFKTLTIE